MLKRGNILAGGIFLLIGLCLLKVAMEPHEMLFADPNAMHIMTYPKILIFIWIGASILYLIGPKDENDWYDFKKARVQLGKVLLCIIVYVFTFEYIGLFGSTLPHHVIAIVREDAYRSAAAQISQPIRRMARSEWQGKAHRRFRQGRLPPPEEAHTAASRLAVPLGSRAPHSGQYRATLVTATPQPGQQRWRER
mgnify:CR=1 FL=1